MFKSILDLIRGIFDVFNNSIIAPIRTHTPNLINQSGGGGSYIPYISDKYQQMIKMIKVKY
jgi:hypothetical protein